MTPRTYSRRNMTAIKLPAFWPKQPEIWFVQAEAQFNLHKVSDEDTRYYHVVAALDQETCTRVSDILSQPPRTGKYKLLKRTLLGIFNPNDRDRASRLLHPHCLGDRKPSELMDEMLSLLGGHEFFILAQQIFLEQMPQDIRICLANDDFSDPRQVAKDADNMLLARSETASEHVHEVTARKKLQEKNTTKQGWCYYHRRFGDNAYKCARPCTHPKSSSTPVATLKAISDGNACLYVRDKNSGRNFLVDTGANISVFPACGRETHSAKADIKLEAANGSAIDAFGKKTLILSSSGRKFNWEFIVASVTQPILGADFLCAHGLMVDIQGQRLVDATSYSSLPLLSKTGPKEGVHKVAADNEYSSLLSDFSAILTPTFTSPSAKHGVFHYIPTTGPPIKSRARRLPPEKLTIARDEFNSFLPNAVGKRSENSDAISRMPLAVGRKTISSCRMPTAEGRSSECKKASHWLKYFHFLGYRQFQPIDEKLMYRFRFYVIYANHCRNRFPLTKLVFPISRVASPPRWRRLCYRRV